MPALPGITDFTDAAVTEGQFKTAFTTLHSYLGTLLGSAGTQAAALAALGALGAGYSLKTSAYTITTADRGKTIAGDSTFELTLPNVATAGAGWSVVCANVGAGLVTVAGAHDINGEPSLDLGSYDSVLIISTGSEWLAVGGGAQRVQIDRVEPVGQAGASGSITIPPWARYGIVSLQGGGGSSGLDYVAVPTTFPGGGGGRGGVLVRSVVTVVSGETSAAYTVGGGGTSGAGQQSTFAIGATVVVAPGGGAGGSASGSGGGSTGANGADTNIGVMAASSFRSNGAAAGSGTTTARGHGSAGRLEVEWR